MTQTRQVRETIYGTGAQQAAEKLRHQMFEWNDSREGDHQIATPWATWTVREADGGWAVFVTEPE